MREKKFVLSDLGIIFSILGIIASIIFIVLSFLNDGSKTIGILLLCACSILLTANVINKKNNK